MPLEPPTETAVRQVPFDAFRSFSDLFATYCSDYDALARYYAGDFRSPDARAAAADRVADHARVRDAVADVLLEQNARWGLDDKTRAGIEALRDPRGVAVVTGQQVGLFTGSLYTPYKTLTALQLARQMAEETGRPVVPVFWLEGGDHDFEEIAGVKLLRQNEPVEFRYTGHALPEEGNLGPVGRLVLTEQIEAVLDEIGATLPPTDFKDELMVRLREAYRPGTTLLDAFARLARCLFPDAGLVFIDPDDARLRRLAAPLFRREIEDHAGIAARLQAVSDELAQQYHAQVRVNPTNLFIIEDDGRFALDAEGDGFRLRGKDKAFSREELLALLEQAPERFSPNVVLRPLVQDTLLPTAAYIAGPSEVAYFAQYGPAYEWAALPMPVIYPRASVSLVEPKVQKVLDKYELVVPDLEEDPDRLFRRLVLAEMEVDVEAVFKEAARPLHQAINDLKPVIEQVDRSLVKTAEATRAALVKEMERLKERVVKAEKRRHDEIHAQLEKAQVNLFPGGILQERALSILYYLNKYGPDLPAALLDRLSLDTTAHQVVDL